MKQKGKIVQFLMTAVLISCVEISLSANGLNFNGIGSKANAMGGAFIGLADDYGAVFWNPAGLTQTKRPTLFLFETNLIPKGTETPFYYESNRKIYPSGAIGYLKPLSDRLVLGLCVYVPAKFGWTKFGSPPIHTYPYSIYENMIAIVTVAPVFAYKVTETFSLGATLNLNYGLMNLEGRYSYLNLSKYNVFVYYMEKTNGSAFGATLGAFFKPSERFSLGLNFRTSSKFNFKGTAKIKTYNLDIPPEDDAERRVTWPLWLGAGIAFKSIDKLTVTADIQYTNWKKVQDIPVTYTNAGWKSLFEEQANRQLKWKDTVQLRLGLEYAIDDKLALRAGYYHDPSPSPIETLNILLPQITYNAITAGFGYHSRNLSVDGCFEVLLGNKTTRTYNINGRPWHETYDMIILIPSITVTYYF